MFGPECRRPISSSLIWFYRGRGLCVSLCAQHSNPHTHYKKSVLPTARRDPASQWTTPTVSTGSLRSPRPPRAMVTDKPSVPTRTSASTCRSTPAHLAADKVVQCRCGHDTNLPYKYFTYPLGIPKNRTLCAASHYYYYLFFRLERKRSAFLSSVGVSARRRPSQEELLPYWWPE